MRWHKFAANCRNSPRSLRYHLSRRPICVHKSGKKPLKVTPLNQNLIKTEAESKLPYGKSFYSNSAIRAIGCGANSATHSQDMAIPLCTANPVSATTQSRGGDRQGAQRARLCQGDRPDP